MSTFGLSTYDAAYLELALRLQCPVATQDEAMRLAVLALQVRVVGQDVPDVSG